MFAKSLYLRDKSVCVRRLQDLTLEFIGYRLRVLHQRTEIITVQRSSKFYLSVAPQTFCRLQKVSMGLEELYRAILSYYLMALFCGIFRCHISRRLFQIVEPPPFFLYLLEQRSIIESRCWSRTTHKYPAAPHYVLPRHYLQRLIMELLYTFPPWVGELHNRQYIRDFKR